MNRFAIPVLAVVLALACGDATAPDPDQPQVVGGPLFEQSPPGPTAPSRPASSPPRGVKFEAI